MQRNARMETAFVSISASFMTKFQVTPSIASKASSTSVATPRSVKSRPTSIFVPSQKSQRSQLQAKQAPKALFFLLSATAPWYTSPSTETDTPAESKRDVETESSDGNINTKTTYRTITSERDYTKALAELPNDQIMLLMFSASSCRACKAILPKLSDTESRYPFVRFYVMDIYDNQMLAQSLKIEYTPTFHFYVKHNGTPGLLEDFACGGFECITRVRRKLDKYSKKRYDENDYQF